MSGDKQEKYGMVPISVFKARSAGAITANDAVIYAAIASFANKYTAIAYPCQKRITELTGSTQGCISHAITRLIDAGLLETKSERRRGRKLCYMLPRHPIGSPLTGFQGAANSDDDIEDEASNIDENYIEDPILKMLTGNIV